MKPISDIADKVDTGSDAAERGHDTFVREKVGRGLAQSRERAAIIPAERVLRDILGG